MITQFPVFTCICTYLYLLYTDKQKAHFLDDDENPDFSLQISPTPSSQAMNDRMEKVEVTLNKILEFLERGNQPNVFAPPVLQPAAPTQPMPQPAPATPTRQCRSLPPPFSQCRSLPSPLGQCYSLPLPLSQCYSLPLPLSQCYSLPFPLSQR